MNWIESTVFIILLVAAALSAAAAAVAWQRRQTPGALALTLLLLAVLAWNITTGLKVATPSVEQFLWMARLEIISQVCATTLFLIFILEYTRQDYLLTHQRSLLLWLIPATSVLLALSNDSHHLFWMGIKPGATLGSYHLIPGSFYWVHDSFFQITRFAATILLITAIVRYPVTYRAQARALLAGTLAIWFGSFFELFRIPHFEFILQIPLHPIAYTVSGLIIGWAILRHKLFDLVPIARDTILENLLDGIVILNNNKQIVDINLPARYLLGIDPNKTVEGASLDDVFSHLPEMLEKISATDMPFQDLYLPAPADLTLEIMSKPIFDRQGLIRGSMLTLHDISARVRSEAAMRQSEENLRNVFENAPFPILVTSLGDGRILYINPAGMKLYELTPAQLKTIQAEFLYPNKNEAQLIPAAVEKTGYADNIELSVQTSSGGRIWVSASARKITYNGEKAILITQIDISEHRRTLDELKQSRAQLKNIFEHADAGIHLIDPSGSIIFSNQRWAEMLEETPGNLFGKNLSDYIFKSDIPYSRHLFESLMAGEIDRYSLELRYLKSNGQLFWGALSAIPIVDKDNGIQSIVNFVSDISKKKETEKALRETERRFREILEKVYLFAIMLDTEGNITFANQYLLAATGWRENEILSENWFEVFQPKNFRVTQQEYQHAIQRGAIVSRHENEILTSDGKTLIVAWSNILLRNANGEITGSASIGEDITERRRAQQSELEQRLFAEALYDTAAVITSTLHFDEVLDRILENIDSAVETDAANISLIEQGKIRFVRAKGYEKVGISNEDIINLRLTINSFKNLKQIIHDKQPICIPDTRAYPGWKEIPTSHWIRSYIGAPIIVENKVVGLIGLDSATPGFFTEEHAERLKAFSMQAAIAIENTRLYTKSLHELEERKRAQARLRHANQKLKSQLEEIKALQSQLREQAIRDVLTGLYNRRYFEEVCAAEIKKCRQDALPLSLLMIDIDHFKVINDKYGHPSGDIILQRLGKLFEQNTSENAIPCRYGGEEFVVILSAATPDQAYRYADEIRMEFSRQQFDIEGQIIQGTISVGIANLYEHGHHRHSLLTAADIALYQAKQAGRNCIRVAKK